MYAYNKSTNAEAESDLFFFLFVLGFFCPRMNAIDWRVWRASAGGYSDVTGAVPGSKLKNTDDTRDFNWFESREIASYKATPDCWRVEVSGMRVGMEGRREEEETQHKRSAFEVNNYKLNTHANNACGRPRPAEQAHARLSGRLIQLLGIFFFFNRDTRETNNVSISPWSRQK